MSHPIISRVNDASTFDMSRDDDVRMSRGVLQQLEELFDELDMLIDNDDDPRLLPCATCCVACVHLHRVHRRATGQRRTRLTTPRFAFNARTCGRGRTGIDGLTWGDHPTPLVIGHVGALSLKLATVSYGFC
jgi:hypothetical protein